MDRCHKCFAVVNKHKYAYIFAKPVDPVALNIPDYFDVVKRPMDFGTIISKLTPKGDDGFGEYFTVEAFASDVLLTLDNCQLYNAEGTDAYQMGATIREEFLKRWEEAGLKPLARR